MLVKPFLVLFVLLLSAFLKIFKTPLIERGFLTIVKKVPLPSSVDVRSHTMIITFLSRNAFTNANTSLNIKEASYSIGATSQILSKVKIVTFDRQ